MQNHSVAAICPAKEVNEPLAVDDINDDRSRIKKHER